jgi:hypothetical protein
MERRFQFSARNMLWATTLAATWCAVVVAAGNYFSSPFQENTAAAVVAIAYIWAIVALPSMAVGALLGRPGIGILCGMASFGGFLIFWAYGAMLR